MKTRASTLRILSSVAAALVALSALPAGAATPTLLRFRVEIENGTAAPVAAGATVDVAVPASVAGRRILRLSASLPVARVDRDGGQVVARVALPTVPPRGRVPITIDAVVGDGAAAPWDDSALMATAGVPAGDPAVVAAARRVARGDDALSRVRGVYRFVRQRVRDDGYHARDRGALFALERGAGDCTEMAQLTVALARAAGVRARLAHGYRVDGAALVDPEGYHAFALVDLGDGGALRVVDPQAGVGPDAPEGVGAAYVVTRLDGPGDPGFHRVRASDPALTARLVPPTDAPAPRSARAPRATDAVRAGQARVCTREDDGGIVCRAARPDEVAGGGCCR